VAALAAAQDRHPRFAAQLGCQERIMLILKGKFLISKFMAPFGAVLMVFALAWMGAEQVQAAPPRQMAPDAVATEFYGWYLDTLGADQDPLSDRHATFNNYVARELTARLVERLNMRLAGSHVPDTDYFLQSRGYQSAWRSHVAATTVRQRGGGADVIVTLGGEEGAKRVLALAMVLEAGSWKIRQVVLAEARPAGTSFDPSTI
jgi:hypothetical protein